MAFTIIPLQIAPLDGGRVDVVCSFDDGAGSVFKEHMVVSSVADLIARAQQRVAEKSGGTDVVKAIAALQGQPLNLAPPTPPDPTPRELFVADVRRLAQMRRAVDLGSLAPDDAGYTALIGNVTSTLKQNPGWVDAF